MGLQPTKSVETGVVIYASPLKTPQSPIKVSSTAAVLRKRLGEPGRQRDAPGCPRSSTVPLRLLVPRRFGRDRLLSRLVQAYGASISIFNVQVVTTLKVPESTSCQAKFAGA